MWRRFILAAVGIAVAALALAHVVGSAASLDVDGGTIQAFSLGAHVETATVPVAAIIDLVAESLDEEAEGEDVTAYIELPRGFDVAAIDVASVVLCTSTACVPADAGPGEVGDFDGDSVTDYMVEFDGRLVIALVADTAAPVEVTFTVSGLVAGVPFAGADAIQIVGPDEDATSPVSTPQVSELSVSPEVSVSPETSEYPRWARRGEEARRRATRSATFPAGSRVTTCRCIPICYLCGEHEAVVGTFGPVGTDTTATRPSQTRCVPRSKSTGRRVGPSKPSSVRTRWSRRMVRRPWSPVPMPAAGPSSVTRAMTPRNAGEVAAGGILGE